MASPQHWALASPRRSRDCHPRGSRDGTRTRRVQDQEEWPPFRDTRNLDDHFGLGPGLGYFIESCIWTTDTSARAEVRLVPSHNFPF
jgi:hypothetical protein